MGFLFDKLIFKEAEVDGQHMDDTPGQTQDYTDDGGQEQPPTPTNTQEQQPIENDNQQDPNNPTMPDDGMQDEPPSTDYTQMGGDDQGYYDQGQGGTPPPPQEESEVDDLKAQEEEMYNNLSPEQLDIKHRELKTQFLKMYDITTSIVERIGEASVSEENIEVVEYISNQLSTLRTMLTDYINSVYKTKSYIENSINYNRFLAVLNGINKILEEMSKKSD